MRDRWRHAATAAVSVFGPPVIMVVFCGLTAETVDPGRLDAWLPSTAVQASGQVGGAVTPMMVRHNVTRCVTRS